jgi:hypothetical protein
MSDWLKPAMAVDPRIPVVYGREYVNFVIAMWRSA